ncbi:MAG: YbhB/YbcL family Raf kinase inhibitor-like protein [Ilumatobacter sp.]|uniref:YbhB/YbcL family Raf kinase inhibitor-like protein n=1 Tax=Ilumatobacter sp. TaxID=1967498 RepID=UPI00260FEB80|nr:YbhB/YbcL family Raf kinase inhibitor-like protein [Ilumatobacter sp.]MDJ0768440.1 YbhB/YbcL family Raf kinase inhibitor-like protein [Ilumatobacter sp.]
MRRPATGHTLLLPTIALVVALAGCDTGDGKTLRDPVFPLPDPPVTESTLPAAPTPAPRQLELFTSWPNGAAFPVQYTCDGDDISPAMSWSNIPADTVELAITVTDVDAGNEAQWIVYGIAPSDGNVSDGEVPDGALVWPNSAGVQGWTGPCPPAGEEHLFVVTVHALNQQLELADDAPASEVISTLNAIAIAQSSVSGRYAGSE